MGETKRRPADHGRRVTPARGHAPAARAPGKRLPPAERERAIIREAVRFFAEHGFEGQTRALAARIGITQPLLYRYFPSKEALIERVYQEVFVGRWNPQWEAWLADRSVPLRDRLLRYYRDYARLILNYEWVRLFTFAGLKGLDLNERFLRLLRERIFARVIAELRFAHGLPSFDEVPLREIEVELVWGLHAGLFYLGARRWIYGLPVPEDVEAVVTAKIEAFLAGAPAVITARLGTEATDRPVASV